MNILFVVPSYKPAYIYGGPIVVVAKMAESLVSCGYTVTVYTTTANGKTELAVEAGQKINVNGVDVFYFKRLTGDHTHISPALWKNLRHNIKTFDVVHIHSWWNILVIVAAAICKLNKVKYILSPHGMFSDYILSTNSAIKKTIIHKSIGKRLLSNSILHVSTQLEWEESQKIIPGWPGKIIPNFVQLPLQPYEGKENNIFTIGFLSRIDPKKGLDILLKALANISFPYKLLIAGTGEEKYVNLLHQLSKQNGTEKNIEWVGWKKENEKFEFLAGLDLFALTSYSENFAIVVIESLAVGTPVLLSKNVGLYRYIEENNFGWVTGMAEENIIQQLQLAYSENEKRLEIHVKSPAVIVKEYKEQNLVNQYIELYSLHLTT